MGCSESKSNITAGNTVTRNKKPAAADYPKKVEKEEDVIVRQGKAKAEENEGQEGAAGADVKEGMQVAVVVAEVEKKDGVEEKPEKLDENVKEGKVAEEKEPEPEKENGENEPAKIEESSTKEAEPVSGVEALPAVAETADAIVTSEATPPEKKVTRVT